MLSSGAGESTPASGALSSHACCLILSSGAGHNPVCTHWLFCAPSFCGHRSGDSSTGSSSLHPSIFELRAFGVFFVFCLYYYYQERHKQSLIFLPGKEGFRAGGKVGLMIGVCNPRQRGSAEAEIQPEE